MEQEPRFRMNPENTRQLVTQQCLELSILSEQQNLLNTSNVSGEIPHGQQLCAEEVENYMDNFERDAQNNPKLQFPGDEKKAQAYYQAIRTSYNAKVDPAEEPEPFSGFSLKATEFKLSADPQDFGSMGVGYATFFLWFKMLLGLVVFPFLLVCLALMWTYWKGSSCYTSDQLEHNFSLLQKVVNAHHVPSVTELKELNQGEGELFTREPKAISRYLESVCKWRIGVHDCDVFQTSNCSFGSVLTDNCSQLVMKLYLGRYRSSICQKSWLTSLNLGNLMGERYEPQTQLAFGAILAAVKAIGLVMYFHALHQSKNRRLDVQHLSIDDISVKITGIPKETENPHQKLATGLVSHNPKYRPKRISLLFDTESLLQLFDALDKTQATIILTRKKIQREQQDAGHNRRLGLLLQREKELFQAISKRMLDFNRDKSKYFLGQAYLSFENIKTAREFYSEFSKPAWDCRTTTKQVGDLKIAVEKSDHPLDIIWRNLHVKTFERIWRNAAAFIASILVFAFNLTVYFYFQIYVEHYLSTQTGFLAKVLEYSVSFIVFLAEEVLEHPLESMANFLKPTTITKEAVSKARRNWLICFANSGLLPLVVAVNLSNYFGQIGLVQNIHNYMLISMFLVPIIKPVKVLTHTWYMKWKQSSIKDALEKKLIKEELFQGKMNEYWKPFNFEMSHAFSAPLKLAAVAFFYMPMVPIIGLYLIITLALLYWSDKYILVAHSHKLVSYSGFLSKKLLVHLEIMVVLFLAGLVLKNYILAAAHHQPLNFFDPQILLVVVFYLLSYLRVFRNIAYHCIKIKLDTDEIVSDGLGIAQRYFTASYEEVLKHDRQEYALKNPAKTFFHQLPDNKQGAIPQ